MPEAVGTAQAIPKHPALPSVQASNCSQPLCRPTCPPALGGTNSGLEPPDVCLSHQSAFKCNETSSSLPTSFRAEKLQQPATAFGPIALGVGPSGVEQSPIGIPGPRISSSPPTAFSPPASEASRAEKFQQPPNCFRSSPSTVFSPSERHLYRQNSTHSSSNSSTSSSSNSSSNSSTSTHSSINSSNSSSSRAIAATAVVIAVTSSAKVA
ncbi:uncharacterized protein LOC135202109 [Macrobrachium nipponense]|uniref:uncharacterized protein LOC135202109 n=1 Tax=Macrobrachium nipponense TaxID=159736 RepID=UPI0030C80732